MYRYVVLLAPQTNTSIENHPKELRLFMIEKPNGGDDVTASVWPASPLSRTFDHKVSSEIGVSRSGELQGTGIAAVLRHVILFLMHHGFHPSVALVVLYLELSA